MHPILFRIDMPEWLQGIFPPTLTIHSYGFLIALGALLGFIYLSRRLRLRHGVPMEQSQNLFILIVAAAFVGGKLLFYLEDPGTYLADPGKMLQRLGGGFVFYGSLLFAIPVVVWFAKRHRIPLLQMLDGIAITVCIVHIFGRLGCFGAGCCYGLPTDGFFSVIYTDPLCMAKPLHAGLHPTQLYSVALILSILVLLRIMERRQRFDGQLFLAYIMLYASGRAVIETFRGDYQRGFLLDGLLSHSQFISLLLVLGVGAYYAHLWRKQRIS